MTTAIDKVEGVPRETSAEDLSTYSGRLGANVRARREKLGMSVGDFATALSSKKVKAKPVTIYAWESGRNPIPVDAIPAIAEALGTTVKKLLPE